MEENLKKNLEEKKIKLAEIEEKLENSGIPYGEWQLHEEWVIAKNELESQENINNIVEQIKQKQEELNKLEEKLESEGIPYGEWQLNKEWVKLKTEIEEFESKLELEEKGNNKSQDEAKKQNGELLKQLQSKQDELNKLEERLESEGIPYGEWQLNEEWVKLKTEIEGLESKLDIAGKTEKNKEDKGESQPKLESQPELKLKNEEVPTGSDIKEPKDSFYDGFENDGYVFDSLFGSKNKKSSEIDGTEGPFYLDAKDASDVFDSLLRSKESVGSNGFLTEEEKNKLRSVRIIVGNGGKIEYNGVTYEFDAKHIKEGLDNLSNDVNLEDFIEEKGLTEIPNIEILRMEYKKGLVDVGIVNAIYSTDMKDEDKKVLLEGYLKNIENVRNAEPKMNDIQIEYDMKNLSTVNIFKRIFNRRAELNELDKAKIVKKATDTSRYGLSKIEGTYKYGFWAKLLNVGRKLPMISASHSTEQSYKVASAINNVMNSKNVREAYKVNIKELNKEESKEFKQIITDEGLDIETRNSDEDERAE